MLFRRLFDNRFVKRGTLKKRSPRVTGITMRNGCDFIMTSEKLIQVFTMYQGELAVAGVQPVQLVEYESTGVEMGGEVSLGHLAWMCGEAICLVTAGRTEKAFRWLGFMQGVMWMQGIYTLDDLKNHSRPGL